MLPQVLKIIFEVQKKRNNEKITKKLKKKKFKLQNVFFFFSLDSFNFWTSSLFYFLFI
jgi:hypothetical protein